MYLNKVELIGYLGRDPEVRTTQGGMKIAKFSVGVTEKRGGTERTEWFNVVAFDRLAEVLERFLKKGHAVYIEGSWRSNTWTTKEGMKRTDWEVKAYDIQLLEKKSPAKSSPPLETLNTDDDLGGWI